MFTDDNMNEILTNKGTNDAAKLAIENKISDISKLTTDSKIRHKSEPGISKPPSKEHVTRQIGASGSSKNFFSPIRFPDKTPYKANSEGRCGVKRKRNQSGFESSDSESDCTISSIMSKVRHVLHIKRRITPDSDSPPAPKTQDVISLENLSKMSNIIFLDLDNWGNFFRKLAHPLDRNIFVWAFYGGNTQWKEPYK